MGGTIYHNPACGTSRYGLGLSRAPGIEPRVVEYLKTPPDEATLRGLLARMGLRARDLLRRKGTPAGELGLDDPAVGEEAIIAAMLAHPILIERPVVVTPHDAALCRPAERVQALLGGGAARG